jgi:aspartyl-tRNA(Asn)/glutamyl-tRNA(Gln) amidotransferase subunit A
MSTLHWLTVAEAAEQIRRKALSPVELTQALLERIAKHDARLNAFIGVTAERALAAARAAEAAVMSGRTLGPLHGVPYGLKDIIDVEGLVTTCHSRILLDNTAHQDAAVARRLAAAGGVLLGKLATHEFAIGGPAFDLPFPPARNPWNRLMGPGGSSSGSGVAVAAGFAPAAIGTDTGGSVRNPASLCGVVGMKATYGRVSRRGVFPLAFSLDHVGPLTRDVRDNALLLNVMAGHDAADPGSAPRPVADYTADLERGVTGLRIGVIRHFYTKDMAASASVIDGIEAALGVWRKLGAEVVDITVPPLQDYSTCNRTILLTEACSIHEAWFKERPGDYSKSTRERMLPGLFLSALDYVGATRWRGELTRAMEQAMAGVDVVVTASSMDPPYPIDDPAAVEKFYPRQARAPFNLTGQPALAIPIGFTADELPLGLQIVGRHWDEAMVYRVARAYERETQWHKTHPTLEG